MANNSSTFEVELNRVEKKLYRNNEHLGNGALKMPIKAFQCCPSFSQLEAHDLFPADTTDTPKYLVGESRLT